ncbi:hypothetical protein RB628_28325 [Streptomyces sp. ADMS]|uniref:hypothetical protein n=1 Tax=Streptomyces sp. ADMS TaxID=3071415 RepID=UPI00296E9A67|nr:hypothetical protein [Streptomyces sp. ADMS]MDW4909137.1 hypothetical protein [Streptomyces sp. ADMS]
MVTEQIEQTQRPIVVIEFGNEIPPRSYDDILPDESAHRRLRVDPLRYPNLADHVPSTAEQAAYWTDRITAAGPPPVAVLAHCSAVGLASALVRALPTPGIPLVLFDPAVPGPGTAQELLAEIALTMDESVEVPDITGLPAGAALEQASAFLLSVVTGASPELDEEILVELTEGQRAWLSFTFAAAAPLESPLDPAHVLLSVDFRWAGPGEVHRTDLAPAELFCSPTVKSMLAEFLTTVEKEASCCLNL